MDQIYQRLVKSEILPIFAIEILKVDDFTTNTYMVMRLFTSDSIKLSCPFKSFNSEFEKDDWLSFFSLFF